MGARSVQTARPLRLAAFRQRLAVDQLHDDERNPIQPFQPINVRDVRMVERGQRLRFAGEPRQPIGIAGEGVRQDFQRDVAVQLRVPRAIHLAHAAGPDGAEDFVRTESHACGQRHFNQQSTVNNHVSEQAEPGSE